MLCIIKLVKILSKNNEEMNEIIVGLRKVGNLQLTEDVKFIEFYKKIKNNNII